jgi:hypothetical protein
MRVISSVLTTLTTSSLQTGKYIIGESNLGQTYSLATAAQLASGEMAMSRTGSVHRVSIPSSLLVCKEYFVTVPSSEPTMKKSFLAMLAASQLFDTLWTPTVAATAVLESGQSSIVVGSASEPVWKMRMALFNPTVTSLVPSGVYARNVGPGVSTRALD